MKSLCLVAAVLFVLLCEGFSQQASEADASLSITINTTGQYPEVILCNSVYHAVVRTNSGAVCGTEHAIRDWVIKSTDQDQVNNYVDACAGRGPIKNAILISDGQDLKKVRFEYRNCDDTDILFISEYTVYPNSPVIRVDYLKYQGWTNTVEIGTPGGAGSNSQAEYRFYGQDGYVRDIQYYPQSYWNTYDGGEYANDPLDGGALNYKNHMIMTVASKSNGTGFARVMPIYASDRGGVRIVKILNPGFECFPGTGQSDRPSYTSYLYVFTNGLDSAIEMGKKIVDGDMLIGGSSVVRDPLPIAPRRRWPMRTRLYNLSGKVVRLSPPHPTKICMPGSGIFVRMDLVGGTITHKLIVHLQ